MFQYPEYFFGLFLIIPLGLILWMDFLRGRGDLAALLGRWRARKFLDVFTVKWFFSSLFVTIFIVFFMTAAAGPEQEGRPDIQTIESRDIVFALDLSLSMLAEDSAPTRLGRSVEIMRGILSAGGGTARFALTAFTGDGVKMIPITEDIAIFESVFASLGPNSLSQQGSDLPAGLLTSLQAFPSGVESERLLFVFSDGENFGKGLKAAVKTAEQRGIRIIAVGAGTAEGASIPLGGQEVLRDAAGKPVVTRLNADNLQYMAQETGGEYFALNDPGLMRKMDGFFTSSMVQYHQPRESAYRFYLLIAVAALYAYLLIQVVQWKNTF